MGASRASSQIDSNISLKPLLTQVFSGYASVSWSSSEVKDMFKLNSNANPAQQPTPSPTSESESAGSSPPVGAIAGGAVGGLGVLLLALGTGFYFWRRRRPSFLNKQTPNEFMQHDGRSLKLGLWGSRSAAELQGQTKPQELASHGPNENRLYEMSG